MSTSINQELVTALLAARKTGQKISLNDFAVENIQHGYAIQRELIARYIVEKPTAITGWKVALSGQKAKEQYQLTEPVYGRLVADMQQQQPVSVQISPDDSVKLEVELAVVLKHDLLAHEHYDDQQLIAAIAEIRPALEIVNIRWSEWKFSLPQFLADNSAAQGYVLGSPVAFDLQNIDLKFVIESSNHDIQRTSTDIDNPLVNYLWLVRKLLNEQQRLNAGALILTGSLIRPLAVETGIYEFIVLGQHLILNVQDQII